MTGLGVSLCRLAARLVGVILIAALAIAGLAVAIFSIEGGSTGLSPPNLAEILGLPSLRDSVDRFLAEAESGGVQMTHLLAGLGAMLLGALLLVGVFAGRQERSFKGGDSDSGRIIAGSGPLASVAEQLAEQVSGVTSAQARVRAGRRGGRLRLDTSVGRGRSNEETAREVESALGPLHEAFGVRVEVRTHVGGPGERLE